MGRTEKRINKRLIGAVIGGTILGLGSLSRTPKGKSFVRRLLSQANETKRFLIRGFKERRRFMGK